MSVLLHRAHVQGSFALGQLSTVCYRCIVCHICLFNSWWTFCVTCILIHAQVFVGTNIFLCVRYRYPGVRMLGYIVIFCFVFEATTHFPKPLLHFAFFLSVCKCCMGVGVRGQLWVSILAFQFVWDKASCCWALTPQGSWLWSFERLSQGFWDCRCELQNQTLHGYQGFELSYHHAQQALYPLSHPLSFHYAFLPVIEGSNESLVSPSQVWDHCSPILNPESFEFLDI